jgi:hypothetical protein
MNNNENHELRGNNSHGNGHGNDNKEITIILNARLKVVERDKYSFQEVVELAFGQFDSNPDIVYTVTYTKGKKQPNKSLVMGENLNVKDGMVINVSRTDKS